MNSTPKVKGWCPGALRPMMSGDGLVVRVRPLLARLTRAQALGLCDAAQAHGAGLIDLTNRANLQIRGVTEAALLALQADLDALGLLDPSPGIEARRNILCAPDWLTCDDTERLALELLARLSELPALPAKIGFAIDAGLQPVLGDAPADFRIERGPSGGLLLRADGRATGMALTRGTEIDALIALAGWFTASGGATAGRMARHSATLPGWARSDLASAPPRAQLQPGPSPLGMALGLAFGQVQAADLAQAITESGVRAVRLTPWRVLVLEGASPCTPAGMIADPNDPTLRVDACAGAPFCRQASVETRALARALAPFVAGQLHVSGCAKGCARGRVADMVLTGRAGRFDLAHNARAGDTPQARDLTTDALLARFGAT